jgi:hypothetical protein
LGAFAQFGTRTLPVNLPERDFAFPRFPNDRKSASSRQGWGCSGGLFSVGRRTKTSAHRFDKPVEGFGGVFTLGARGKTAKKRAPQSCRDFELNARTRTSAIADVLWSFTREVRSINILNYKSSRPKRCCDPFPSLSIPTADVGHRCVAVLSVNGENCVRTPQGDEAVRFVEVSACNM